MSGAKHVHTPTDPHVYLTPVENDKMNQNELPFREEVGNLMFLATITRPDLAYAVGYVRDM